MSKSNIVRGPTLSQEILCERRTEGEGRNTIVPLMHFFDKKKKKYTREEGEKNLHNRIFVPVGNA